MTKTACASRSERAFISSIVRALNAYHENSAGLVNEQQNTDFIKLAIALVEAKRRTVKNNVVSFPVANLNKIARAV